MTDIRELAANVAWQFMASPGDVISRRHILDAALRQVDESSRAELTRWIFEEVLGFTEFLLRTHHDQQFFRDEISVRQGMIELFEHDLP